MPEQIEINLAPIKRKDRKYPISVYSKVIKAVELTLSGVVKNMLLTQLRLRTANWRHRPDFVLKGPATSSQQIRAFYGLSDGRAKANRLYKFVTRGVRGHAIVAHRRKALRIRGGAGGYRPHTTAGSPSGYGGPGVYTGSDEFRRWVDWPGIQPRFFEADIYRSHSDAVRSAVRRAVEQALG